MSVRKTRQFYFRVIKNTAPLCLLKVQKRENVRKDKSPCKNVD